MICSDIVNMDDRSNNRGFTSPLCRHRLTHICHDVSVVDFPQSQHLLGFHVYIIFTSNTFLDGEDKRDLCNGRRRQELAQPHRTIQHLPRVRISNAGFEDRGPAESCLMGYWHWRCAPRENQSRIPPFIYSNLGTYERIISNLKLNLPTLYLTAY